MCRFSLPTNVFLAPQQAARPAPAPAPRLGTDTKYATLGRPRTGSGHQNKGGIVATERECWRVHAESHFMVGLIGSDGFIVLID